MATQLHANHEHADNLRRDECHVEYSPSRFTIEPLSPLPKINTSRTLWATLLRRDDDRVLNKRVVQAIQQYQPLLHATTVVFSLCCCFADLVQTASAADTLSVISIALMAPGTFLCLAGHLYDQVALTVKTFEFWFLTLLNAIGFVTLCLVLQDARILTLVLAAFYCETAFLVDGNFYARRLLHRSFAIAAPLISAILVAMKIRYTPRMKHVPVQFGRVLEGDLLDIAIQCFATMAWFLAVKVVRSRHLILPAKTPIETVQCEVYYPLCGLVEIKTRLEPFTSSLQPRRNQKATDLVSLRLIRRDMPDLVTTNNTFISYEKVPLLGVQCVNLFGYIGFFSSWFSLLWFVVWSNRVEEPSGSQVAVAVLGIVMTTVFFTIHLCHASLVLLRRMFVSLDAWFVSVHFTIITIGVCDVVFWDQRGIFVLPPWLWCHWVMILDSITPLTKRRLVLRPSFVTTTTMMLVLYPAVLAYWIFFSESTELRNRVVLRETLFGSEVRMEVYSLLLSRLWTLWLWMGRFLWRELFLPVHAFKLLRFRVEYDVGSSLVASSRPQSIYPGLPRS